MDEKQPKFKVARWIMLSFAILLNAFIIFYSCLDSKTTGVWNDAVTTFFTNLVNTFTHKEVPTTPLEGISINLSNEEGYVYNYIPGYQVDEIPLGSAKQIECAFSPIDASNKSITYSANPAENVNLNQSGSTLSVVGLKLGECVITAKSSEGSYESSTTIKVVETVAPTSYEISLENSEIAIGTTQTINFDIDGGPLTHDELINFRYYDTRKLAYSSLDESVATVDKYGVIYPLNEGTTTINVNNGTYSKSLDINVTSGTPHPNYTSLSISGSDTCYANDMIMDQNTKKNHYQLTPKDEETELDPEDFIWKSSNELLVKVDKHGVMRGFRKDSFEEETATITAVSKLTGQETSMTVKVQNELPNKLSFYLDLLDKQVWNPSDYTFTVGDIVTVRVSLTPRPYVRTIEAVSSDENIIKVTNEGEYFTMNVVKEGSCKIKITPIINPEIAVETTFNVIKSGAINTDDLPGIYKTLRKSIGHAAVFMVAQIFTYLTFFMFFNDRKWYVWTSMSLGEGLFISGLSELIQHFVPSRTGAWLDVLINFGGVVVGAALAFLGIFITYKIISKKHNSEIEK